MQEKTPDNKPSLLEKIVKMVILPIAPLVPIVFLLLLIISIPTPVLDVFIVVNLFFAVMILITAVRVEKAADFSLLPTLLLIFTIFSLSLNVAAVRLILTKGADFDGLLIRFVSFIFTGSEGIIQMIIGSAVFIVIIDMNISKVDARFILDSMAEKFKTIETECSSGAISKEEAALRKEAIQNESDFFGSLDGACKFISGNEKCRLFIAVITIFGGILIHSFAGFFFFDNFPDGKCDITGFFFGTVFFEDGISDSPALGILLNNEKIIDAVRIYSPLVIGSWILFIIPSLLLSFAVERIEKKKIE